MTISGTEIVIVYPRLDNGRPSATSTQVTLSEIASLSSFSIVDVTSTTKTLGLTDASTIQDCTNAATQTITIPADASVDFNDDTLITFMQSGVGNVTVTAAGGVTLNGTVGGSVTALGQYTGFNLIKISTNVWQAIGSIGNTGSLTISGNLAVTGAVNASTAQTTLSGTGGGTIVWSEPFQGSSFKKFVGYANAYENNTAVNQTISFTTAFANTPIITGNGTGLTLTASTTALTITSPNSTSTFTGNIIIEGA